MNQPNNFPPQQARPTAAPPVEYKVVGLSFVDGYPDNILNLEAAMIASEQHAGDAFIGALVRNPANEFDANAIEVHVVGAGMIGHLDRHTAAVLAPLLDGGATYTVVVKPRVDPDHRENPGATVEVSI